MHVQVLCTDIFMHALTFSKFGDIKLSSALICRERQELFIYSCVCACMRVCETPKKFPTIYMLFFVWNRYKLLIDFQRSL